MCNAAHQSVAYCMHWQFNLDDIVTESSEPCSVFNNEFLMLLLIVKKGTAPAAAQLTIGSYVSTFFTAVREAAPMSLTSLVAAVFVHLTHVTLEVLYHG